MARRGARCRLWTPPVVAGAGVGAGGAPQQHIRRRQVCDMGGAAWFRLPLPAPVALPTDVRPRARDLTHVVDAGQHGAWLPVLKGTCQLAQRTSTMRRSEGSPSLALCSQPRRRGHHARDTCGGVHHCARRNAVRTVRVPRTRRGLWRRHAAAAAQPAARHCIMCRVSPWHTHGAVGPDFGARWSMPPPREGMPPHPASAARACQPRRVVCVWAPLLPHRVSGGACPHSPGHHTMSAAPPARITIM